MVIALEIIYERGFAMNQGMKNQPLLNLQGWEKNFRLSPGLWNNFSRRLQAKAPDSITVFKNFHLNIAPGECIGITGANGSGKSTLLRCISGVLAKSSGTSLGAEPKILSVLGHGLGAYDDLTALRNIILLLQLFGLTRKEAQAAAAASLEWAGLKEQTHRVCSQLSEGQRARLPLAALRFASFDLLCLDESLNYIDKEFRDLFYALTRDWLQAGRSILLTSHDATNIERFCTRTISLP